MFCPSFASETTKWPYSVNGSPAIVQQSGEDNFGLAAHIYLFLPSRALSPSTTIKKVEEEVVPFHPTVEFVIL